MVSKNWFFLFVFLAGQISLCATTSESFQNVFNIPFRLAKELIIVEAVVNNKKGLFIVDTGASSLVLCSSYFSSRNEPTHFSHDFGGSQTELAPLRVRFQWPNTKSKKKLGMLTDLRKMKSILGFSIMGYIGHNILKDYEIIFDYSKRTLTLFELTRKGERISRVPIHNDASDTIAMKKNGFLPFVTVQLGGQKLRFGIDSGATMNLICPKKVKKIPGYFQHGVAQRTAAFNGKEAMVPSGKIGGIKINNIYWNPMKCVQKKMGFINFVLRKRLDGLLGYEFLKQHKTAINFKKNQLYIWNNNNRKESVVTSR